jgi:hypothetical protein
VLQSVLGSNLADGVARHCGGWRRRRRIAAFLQVTGNLRSSLGGLGSLRGGGGVLTRWRGRGTETHPGQRSSGNSGSSAGSADRDRGSGSGTCTMGACACSCSNTSRSTKAPAANVRTSNSSSSAPSRRPGYAAALIGHDDTTQTLPPELRCSSG